MTIIQNQPIKNFNISPLLPLLRTVRSEGGRTCAKQGEDRLHQWANSRVSSSPLLLPALLRKEGKD